MERKSRLDLLLKGQYVSIKMRNKQVGVGSETRNKSGESS